MNKTGILVLLLLLSVGVNLGLGARLVRLDRPDELAGPPDWTAPSPGPEGPGPGFGRLMERRLARLAQQLELTPGQSERIAAIHRDAGSAFFARRQAIGELRERLRDLALGGAADRSAVLALQRELSVRQAELDSVVVETMLREIAVLDARQRERYRTLMPWEGGGPGHGRPRGGRRPAG